MHVLMITSDAEVLRDGSPQQAAIKEQALLTSRLMVIVMNSYWHRSNARKISDSLWVFPTNSWFPFLKILDAMRLIRQEIFYRNKLQADLIVANDPFTSAMAAVLEARKYKKPMHIYVAQNLFTFYYTTRSPITLFKSTLARVLLGFANTVSVAHESIRTSLIRLDPSYAERVTCIALSAEEIAGQAHSNFDLHEKYTQFRALLLVVAPFTVEHNITLAIDVLKQVLRDHAHVGLVIVGSGWGKLWLRYYALREEVSRSVMFETPRDDMVPVYKSAFALLVPSHFTAFETTIEDAAAAGCAVISSPVGIAPKLIKNKENGFICNPNHMLDFADAVNTLLNNEVLRSSMRKKISESAKAMMTPASEEHMLSRKKAWEAAITSARGY
jgi:glycosyltransferase involved in cell wall biosynthesis